MQQIIPKAGQGLVLECDAAGIITKVLWDDLGLSARLRTGQPLSALVERESRAKAHNFVLALRAEGATFDWELNVPLGGTITTLRFAGITSGDSLLVLAAKSNGELMKLYEALAAINNEQTNVLRGLLKERVMAERAPDPSDTSLYDELSRLNNELADAQRQLAKQNAELERLNALKNQFLGMAAHDLRSPLSILLGYSEFLLEDLRDSLSAEHVEFLETIHASSQFMLQLVNELLDVSIIESGRLELHIERTDLVGLTQHSVALNRVLAARKQINVTFHSAGEIPQLLVDPGKIRQMLDNLLSNAIKYSQPGTEVTVSLTRQGQEVILAVADQGQGIPADEMHKLFQWLGKTSVRSTGGEKSSGLGLAIAKRIIEGHRGRLWAESEVGKGSTFYVALPVEEPEAVADSPAGRADVDASRPGAA